MKRGGSLAPGLALAIALAGCGHPAPSDNSGETAQLNEAGAMVEDTSPDSLTVPDNMAVREESNTGELANGD